MKSRKERNKKRKSSLQSRKSSIVTKESPQKSPTSSTILTAQPSNNSTAETKRGKTRRSLGRLSYTSKGHEKLADCQKCRRPLRTRDYLDSVTHSYAQAGLIDASALCCKETCVSSRNSSSISPPCEKCNPNYYFHDNSNDEHVAQKYSLFGKFQVYFSFWRKWEGVNSLVLLCKYMIKINLKTSVYLIS